MLLIDIKLLMIRGRSVSTFYDSESIAGRRLGLMKKTVLGLAR